MRNESADIIKLAVAFEARTELFKIDQSIPLAPQLLDLCNVWHIPAEECGDYGLLFDPEKSKDISDRYITEDNRTFIKLGSMLKLTLSPEKMSDKIAGVLKRLPPGTLNEGEVVLEAEEATKVLSDLLYLSVDSTFITAFNRAEIKGLDLIMEAIQTGRATGNHLETCLQVFVNMMVEGARPWEEVPDAFVKKIMGLSEQPMANVQGSIMHSILVILENLLLAGPDAKFNLVDARVNYSILANHLEYSEKKISQAVVALVNALMQKAPSVEVRQRIGRNLVHDMRQAVLAVVRNCNGVPWTEMYDQLYQLQTSLLGLYETKFLAIVEPGSVDDMDKVKHLRRVAFDEAGVVGNDKDKRKDHYSLGFSDEADPLKDFSAPPARLALDCLTHYAEYYERQFARMAIENSSKDPGKFQLVEAAVKLVTLLCDVLEIRSTPAAQESNGSPVPGATTLGGSMAMRNNFQPMFFSSEYPLEDFFCRCMDLFQKTWKEMKATVQDMDKVLEVVQEQLKRALALKPPAMGFGGFADHLENLSFAQIKAMRDVELDRHFRTAEQAEPIRQLRDTLKVEIISIIAEQRTLFLTDGSRFIKTAGRGRLKDGVKYWFCRLAPNRKALHYGDCKEEKDETIPSIDSLQSKLELANVDELVVGDKCPHYNKGKVAGHYFSLRYRNDGGEYESLNFICSDEKTFHYWCDGINCLLRGENAMDSQEFERDMEILLSMEVKLRLLDVGALEIPEKAPELPPLPKKFLPA